MRGRELLSNPREGLPAGATNGFSPPDQGRGIDFTVESSKECKEVSATSARRQVIKLANKRNLGLMSLVLSLLLVFGLSAWKWTRKATEGLMPAEHLQESTESSAQVPPRPGVVGQREE